jgi:hypothetical protein
MRISNGPQPDLVLGVLRPSLWRFDHVTSVGDGGLDFYGTFLDYGILLRLYLAYATTPLKIFPTMAILTSTPAIVAYVFYAILCVLALFSIGFLGVQFWYWSFVVAPVDSDGVIDLEVFTTTPHTGTPPSPIRFATPSLAPTEDSAV